MKVEFTPQAFGNLDAISEFIRTRNPAAADRVRAAILSATETLSTFPEGGRAQSMAGVRKIVVRKYPYIIYYTVDHAAEAAVVIAIRHSARHREHSDL